MDMLATKRAEIQGGDRQMEGVQVDVEEAVPNLAEAWDWEGSSIHNIQRN